MHVTTRCFDQRSSENSLFRESLAPPWSSLLRNKMQSKLLICLSITAVTTTTGTDVNITPLFLLNPCHCNQKTNLYALQELVQLF